MFTDAATITGSHRFRLAEANRDHAIAGRTGEHTYWGIVSDGCSASGMTDVGARVVAGHRMVGVPEQNLAILHRKS